MSQRPSIMLFDSGVGGLSVLADIRRRRPDVDYYYVLDNAAFPYGLLSEDELVERVVALMRHLVACHPVHLLVIACNTASTVVLPALRQALPIPVVGVVPAIKPAAALSRSDTLGLLATPGTISRAYTEDLISRFAPDSRVLSLAANELVIQAEAKLSGEPVSMASIQDCVQSWVDEPGLDTVVLGCTHFPLLLDELSQCLPQVAHWIDSGEAIARRVDYLLCEHGIERGPGDGQGQVLYATSDTPHWRRIWEKLGQHSFRRGQIESLLGEKAS